MKGTSPEVEFWSYKSDLDSLVQAIQKGTLEQFSTAMALPRSMVLSPNPRFKFRLLEFADFP